jgi:hypothetical protein
MKTCISVVVDHKYQKYVPFFVYFVQQSYPDYFIKIFLTEKINNKYLKAFSLVKTDKIEYLENCFSGFPKAEHQQLKCLRWIIPESFFQDFDYVYMGDVDMLICKESVSLVDQHINNMNLEKLPYSNIVRPNSERMSGLHFMSNEYFKEIEESRNHFEKIIKSGKRYKNENFLYKLIKHSGLPFPSGLFRPHHGIHLGLWRKGVKSLSADWYCPPMNPKKSEHLSYYNFYLDQEKTKTFQDLSQMISLPELIEMKKYFNQLSNI